MRPQMYILYIQNLYLNVQIFYSMYTLLTFLYTKWVQNSAKKVQCHRKYGYKMTTQNGYKMTIQNGTILYRKWVQ